MDAFFRCLKNPGTTAVVFRRSYGELEDTDIKEAQASYPEELCVYNAGRHEFKFKHNGSKILFRHCENAADRFKYSGIEIQFLYFDELTSFEQEIYDFIKTRLRAKKSLGVVPIVRSASNPGNIGHGWVKKMFVDAGPYMEIQEQEIWSETLHKAKKIRTQYIPALATENPFITDDYIFELEQKPEALRRALLNGDWDSFEGQAFPEICIRPENLDRKWTHVIEPFDIPHDWPRYFSFDYGYSDPFACQWWAMDHKGIAYLYREWYGCVPRKADTGIKLTPVQIADGILEREESEIRDNIKVIRTADPSIFDKSRGYSVADQMAPGYQGRTKGVLFNKGDNTRIAGKMEVHERLRFDENGIPGMYIFKNCYDWIRTVPNLPYDEKKVEDIDTDAEDHDYDATRYFLMDHPMTAAKKPPRVYKPYDPFDRDQDE